MFGTGCWAIRAFLAGLLLFVAGLCLANENREFILHSSWPDLPESQKKLDSVPFARNAPAVILLEARQDDWRRRGAVDVHSYNYFLRTKILTPDGVERYKKYRKSWPKLNRVDFLRARTILPDGRIIDAGGGVTHSFPKGGGVQIAIDYPEVQVGAILEFNAQLYEGIDPDFSIDPWPVAHEIPVLESRVIFIPPWGLIWDVSFKGLTNQPEKPAEVSFREEVIKLQPMAPANAPMKMPDGSFGIPLPQDLITMLPGTPLPVAPGAKAYIWRFYEIPSAFPEPHSPLDYAAGDVITIRPRVYSPSNMTYSIAKSWEEWTKDYVRYWDQWMRLAPVSTQTLGRKAAQSEASPLAKAAAIGVALRRAVSVENHGFKATRPNPDQVLGYKTGNTAELAALAVIALKAVGVDADLAPTQRRGGPGIPIEYPLPAILDDLLVRIKTPNGNIFWSPAAETPVGELPFELSEVPVLILDGAPGERLTTPGMRWEANKISRSITGRLDVNGDMRGEAQLTYLGHPGSQLRGTLKPMNEADRAAFFTEMLQKALPTVRISELKIPTLDQLGQPLQVVFRWNAPGGAQVEGNRLTVPGTWFDRFDPGPWKADRRLSDIELGIPGDVSDTIKISIPENVDDVETPDQAHQVVEGLGVFDGSCDGWNNRIAFRRQLRIEHSLFDRENWPLIKKFFTSVGEFDAKPVVVVLAK